MRCVRNVVVALIVAGGVSGCAAQAGHHDDGSTSAHSSVPTAPRAPKAPKAPKGPKARVSRRSAHSSSDSAAAVLGTLPVKGRAPMTGYDRDEFGTAWTDDNTDLWGHNGCDTRNDILRRDLTDLTIKADSNGCAVLAGVLADPYTGHRIHFVRGEGTSTAVEIDHVVALGDAWQTGAQRLSAETRQNYANDPLVLLAVDGPTNLGKGDGDAATWLPPNKAYRCTYVARQIAIKHKYGLWVTPAERDAMARVLSACPRERLPTISSETQHAPARLADTPPSAPRGNVPQSTGHGLDPRFATCSAANAAGYGPYVSGKDPEYAWYRDADGDGTDCEP